VCPKELILREWRSPDWEILLANGHRIAMRTVRGSLEGASAVGILIDEVHMVPDEKIWLNYQARARDPRARQRKVIASGVPMQGWLQGCFDGEEQRNDPNRMNVFMSALENTYLPSEVIEQFRRSAPGKAAEMYIHGRWISTPGDKVYFEFNPARHFVNKPGNRGQFVHIGLDVGTQSHAVFAQETKASCKDEHGRASMQPGLHFVDEMRILSASSEAVCRQVRERGWRITDQSCLMVDPMIRADEIDAIRRVFPKINLIRRSKKNKAHYVEPGHHAVNCALNDADGNTRLTFSNELSREPGHLYHSFLNFKRTSSRRITRDNLGDHCLDAMRYLVQHCIPVIRGGIEVYNRL